MLPAKQVHSELLWWIVLLTLVGIVTLFMIQPATGNEPARSTPDVDGSTVGMAVAALAEDFRAGDLARASETLDLLDWLGDQSPLALEEDAELAIAQWSVLVRHSEGRWSLAVPGWRNMSLALEHRVWRHVALAAAYLEQGELEHASDALDAAARLEPGHPVVHYLAGLWHLDQAIRAHDWPDALGHGTVQFASHPPRKLVPNSRSMYELAATVHLEKAIDAARMVDYVREQPLCGSAASAGHVAWPTIGDLMIAVGVADFEADAHDKLARVFLVRAHLEAAESHLDSAASLGANVGELYRTLAKAYEAEGNWQHAVGVHAKSLKNDPNAAGELFRMLRAADRAVGLGLLP